MSDAADPSQTDAGPTTQAGPVDFVALSAGRMIGRYKVVAVLGQGGFGITYRALDDQLGREVAIKEYLPAALAVRQDGTTVLPRSTSAADDFTWGRERFVAEGRTLANLQDAPGIVRVFDYLESNGTAYIVMQLLQGETLESRLARSGPLSPDEVGRILWPLLDGLEQVHGAGFLHRDIKPANILLDAKGNPTLIDFGAARAAIAGHSAALTAIFTPGYAAAEQMSSAKQGPWTDIYGLSATLYHAITGERPPSAFDRMLDDTCEPLTKKALPAFGRGLLVGLDLGLSVRATDRPQAIAGWRPILSEAVASDGIVTMAMGRTASPAPATTMMPAPPVPNPTLIPSPPSVAAPPAKRRGGLWISVLAVLLLVVGGGSYFYMQNEQARASKQAAVDKAAQDAQLAAEAQRLKDEEELAKLRAEAAARDKAQQEAARRRRIEEETRLKVEAELATRQREQDAVRQKAEADAAAARQATEGDKKAAEVAESGLRFTLLDRQRVQVALTALGFDTASINGAFSVRTRDQIAAWQKSHNYPSTGFLNGVENQALLREAAPAVSRFDDEQKRREEERARATAAATASPPQQAMTAAVPNAAPSAPAAASGPDGPWRGTLHCSPSRGGPAFTINFQINLSGGSGMWSRPGYDSNPTGTKSLAIRVTGQQAVVTRVYHPFNQPQTQTATLPAHFDGNSITASGPEGSSGGRSCDLLLARAQ
jgi:serine/threonine protein kinase/peptidoglycan hydrolase-like protein with peptidoglycan-binding domain